MNTNLSKHFVKIYTAFSGLGNISKAAIKYGIWVFLLIFAVGTFMVVYNRIVLAYDPQFEFIATSLVRTSFVVLAEAIIGALALDYIFSKKSK